MQTLTRIVCKNINSQIQRLEHIANPQYNAFSELLSYVKTVLSLGYTAAVTSSGVVRKDMLEGLLDIDNEISLLIGEMSLSESKLGEYSSVFDEIVSRRLVLTESSK